MRLMNNAGDLDDLASDTIGQRERGMGDDKLTGVEHVTFAPTPGVAP